MQNKHVETIWHTLLDGNRRYTDGAPPRADTSAQRRRDTAQNGQHPLAAVVACSDSRVPVELLFDAGVGDLFIIRVAGNVIGAQEAGSLEYAVEHLGVPLILILGHTLCGAVSSALFCPACGGAVEHVLQKIAPAAQRSRTQCGQSSQEELLQCAVIENVHQAISDLLDLSPLVQAACDKGSVTVAGALYDTEAGTVTGLNISTSTFP
jgi:carbonic anhydrase